MFCCEIARAIVRRCTCRRIASGGSERDVLLRDSQRKLIEDAQAEYLNRLTNAWKEEPRDGGRR
jgi:hypothetical protein